MCGCWRETQTFRREVRILSAQNFCVLQADRSVVNQARTGSQYQPDTDICMEIAERSVYMSCNIPHTRGQTEHIFKRVCLWLFHPLEHSGHYTYHKFNIHQLYVLPTQCIYVFCVDLRTNSD